MSLNQRRWVVIDDSSQDVSYSGDWFVDAYSSPGPSQYVGSASGGTAHGTSTTGGFAFSFEGTAFVVRGQSSVIPAQTDSSLRCTVDGVESESEVVNSRNLRSWRLCRGEGLSGGLHQVVVNITSGANTVFWLDEIFYYSLSPPNLRHKTSMLFSTTVGFRYTSISWMNPFDRAGNLGRESYQHGAKAIIPFYGTSVELSSYLTSSMPRAAGAATYSIDGGPLVNFIMPAWTPGFRGLNFNDSIFRHTILITPPVSPGQHTLELTNLGDSTTVPLAIDYFLIHHGDVPATGTTNTNTNPNPGVASVDSSNPSALPSESRSNYEAQTSNVGVIVGAVVGVLALLAGTTVLVYWIRKRRQASTPNPPSQWVPGDYVALNPRDNPVDSTPYERPYERPYEPRIDTPPSPPASVAYSLPDYAPSENGSDTTFQQAMMYRSMPKQPIAWST